MTATPPRVLAFDTSGPWVAVCLAGDGTEVLQVEEMARGQAERLFGLIGEVLAEAGLDYGALDRIGVGTGPGNFTGLRIAVSAARGLALALETPAIGIGGLEALARAGLPAALPAPRGRSYRPGPDGAPELTGTPAPDLDPAALVRAIAELAAEAEIPAPRPAPIYVRPADAAPPADPPPRILP